MKKNANVCQEAKNKIASGIKIRFSRY
jgi:hypothetical protein